MIAELRVKDYSDLLAFVDDQAFWDLWRDKLVPLVEEVFGIVFRAGAQAGLTIEPATKELLPLDPEAINNAFDRVVTTYTDEWWRQFIPSTQRQMRDSIRRAQAQGTGVEGVIGDLENIFGTQRAMTIASTECLPPETLVDSAVVRTAFRRWFDGEMVEIVTRKGRRFSATPNHPMLTTRGWLGAGEITESDYLVCETRGQRLGRSGNPDVKAPPTSIAEIFNSLSAVRVLERVSGAEPDFHGDGRKGQVDVLGSDRVLRIGAFAPLYKPVLDKVFTEADVIRAAFCPRCGALLGISERGCGCGASYIDTALQQASPGNHAANAHELSDGNDRFTSLITSLNRLGVEVFSIAALSAACHKRSSLPGRPPHPSPFQGVIDPTYREAREVGHGRCAQAAQIEIDRVSSISRRIYSGHVYNLSTPYGYFTIGGGAFTGNTTRLFGLGAQAAYSAAGLDQYEWQTVEDGFVCERCRERNKTRYPIAVPFAPLHPRCRCFPRPVVDESTPAPGTDRRRRPRAGETDVQEQEQEPESENAYPKQGFTDRAAVERWMHRKFPNVRFHFDGTDIISANNVAREIDRLGSRWPQIMKRLEFVGSDARVPVRWRSHSLAMKNNTYAFATRDGKVLMVNSRWFEDHAKLQASIERDRAAGWHPKMQPGTSAEAEIMAHEFGHQIDNFMLGQTSTVGGYARASGLGMAGTTQNAIRNQHEKAGRKISRYGTENGEEMWAESFATSQYGTAAAKANPYVKAQTRFLEVFHPSRWTTQSVRDMTFTGDIKDEALRRRINQELLDLADELGLVGY